MINAKFDPKTQKLPLKNAANNSGGCFYADQNCALKRIEKRILVGGDKKFYDKF